MPTSSPCRMPLFCYLTRTCRYTETRRSQPAADHGSHPQQHMARCSEEPGQRLPASSGRIHATASHAAVPLPLAMSSSSRGCCKSKHVRRRKRERSSLQALSYPRRTWHANRVSHVQRQRGVAFACGASAAPKGVVGRDRIRQHGQGRSRMS